MGKRMDVARIVYAQTLGEGMLSKKREENKR